MFSKVDTKKKDDFLDQTKARRELRSNEKYKDVAAIKIQVCEWFCKKKILFMPFIVIMIIIDIVVIGKTLPRTMQNKTSV